MENQTIAIVAPCFNEGNTAIFFLQQLEKHLGGLPQAFQIVIVDDSSTDNTPDLLKQFDFTSANLSLHLLSNIFNLGHQGAIYQGLLYANSLDASYTIVMDSDGEDDPAAIPVLLQNQE